MNMILAVRDAYQAHFGTGGYGVMFVAAVIWLLRCRDCEEKAKRLLGPMAVLALLTACPLTAKLFMLVAGEDVYWRIFWLFPVYFVLAAAGSAFIYRMPSGWKRALTGVLCIGMVAINGTFVLGSAFFTPRENNFKLPTPVIRIADAVNAHAMENHIRKKKSVYPAQIAVYIRIYDATILQRYGRFSLTHDVGEDRISKEINKEELDFEKIDTFAKKYKLRYVTLEKRKDDREKMEALGYECIYDDVGYVVYFRTKYYKNKDKNKTAGAS